MGVLALVFWQGLFIEPLCQYVALSLTFAAIDWVLLLTSCRLKIFRSTTHMHQEKWAPKMNLQVRYNGYIEIRSFFIENIVSDGCRWVQKYVKMDGISPLPMFRITWVLQSEAFSVMSSLKNRSNNTHKYNQCFVKFTEVGSVLTHFRSHRCHQKVHPGRAMRS